MNKDVIYIDVEDDITAIIGKIKASKEKVVALVPPKRVGVLQSAVNLRLLNRMAGQANKKIAIITNNHALMALSAAASIPVARNLQTPPTVADIPALTIDDDEDNVIEGASLPVGDHASQLKSSEDKKEARSAAMAAALADAPKSGDVPKSKVKKTPKAPNFDLFRKKMVIIVAAAILLIGFGIWAIFFAPRATVVIRAKTTSSSINAPVSIKASTETSFEKGTIKAISQEKSEDKKIEFQATGKKDAGKKASGTVQFATDSISVAAAGVSIPAGTKLQSSSGLTFTTDSSVSITLASPSGTTGVTAAENGSKYNAASGAVSGAPSGVSASFASPTSGGVTKNITVVTAADVQKARTALAEENTDTVRDSLKAEFKDKDIMVIDESFAVEYKDVSSSPAVGEEASSATLEATIIHTLYGVSKSEASIFLDEYLKDELDGNQDQRVYNNGADKVTFQEASDIKGGAKATLITTAQVGPVINDDDVKNQVKGKRHGEIQESLESIQGIEDVDVKLFPFWVNTVPDDTKKITVEFSIDAEQ